MKKSTMNVKMSLLIVDDREDNLLILESLIREYFPDVEIFKATTAADGIQLAAEKQVDGALIDLQMLKADGIKMCRKLKANENTRHIPLILLTFQRTTPELRAKGLEAGADDFICYPFDNLEFVARVRVMLRGKRVEDKLRKMNEQLEALVAEKIETLRESEEQYCVIAKDLPVLICCFLPGGEIMFMNKAYCEYFSRTQEELVGSSFFLLIPEADRETVMTNISALTVDKPVQSHEHRVILPDGEIRWQRWINRAIFDARGKTVIYQSIGEDITEYKKVAEALSVANSIINRSPVVAFVWKNEEGWPVEFVSENVEKLTGYSAQEFIEGKLSYVDIIYSEDLERVTEEVGDYNKKERLQTHAHKAYRIITKNGDITWIDDITYIRRDSRGIITHFEGIVYDITERKQTEEALRESEEKYRTIFENAQVGLYRSRPDDGKMLMVNLRMAEMFGYENPEDCVAEYCVSKHYVDTGTSEKLFNLMREYGKFTNFEALITKRDGSPVWIQYSGKFFSEMGFFEGVATDVTKRRQTEEALRENEKQLQSLINAMPDFVCFKDENGCWLEANDAAIRIFQLEGIDYKGKKDSELAELNSHLQGAFLTCEKSDAMAWNEGCLFRGEEMVSQPDGVVRVYDVVKVPLFNPDGSRKGIVVLGHDITNRKQAEEKLKKRMNDLEIFNDAAVNRELIVNELRREINELLRKSDKGPKYEIVE